MRIKVAFLESDKTYLSRIVNALGGRYADKIQIYSYTDLAAAYAGITSERIAVLVADRSFEVKQESLPAYCSLVFFSESSDVESIRDCPAICKYQKIEQIYKGILNVYSENAQMDPNIRLRSEGGAKLIVVTSPCGGVGSSSVAVALARRFAKRKQRVLYLNLEKTGSSDLYFIAQGQFTMSDVVFAVKSRRANLRLKLESCARQDNSGVYFFATPNVALDIQEMSIQDEEELLDTVLGSGIYDYVIMDRGFGMDLDSIRIFNKAVRTAWICGGSETSVVKTLRAYQALEILEKKAECLFLQDLAIVYNKFDNARSAQLPVKSGWEIAGAIPEFRGTNELQVVARMEEMSILDRFA